MMKDNNNIILTPKRVMKINTKVVKNNKIMKDDIKIILPTKSVKNMIKDDDNIVLTPKRVVKIDTKVMENKGSKSTT